MTDRSDDEPLGPPDALAHLKGMDLVRRALEEARGAAKSQGKDVGRGRTSSTNATPTRGFRRRWSGPGPDSRDPQTLAAATSAWRVGCRRPNRSSQMIAALAATPRTSVQPSARTIASGPSTNSVAMPSDAAPATRALTIVWGSSNGLCHRSRPSHWLNRNAV